MLDKVFDINQFNIIQDDNYYYFFRALNDGDYNDITNGITLENGVVKRIRTDLERFQDIPLYKEDDEISLEEVHDHIKWQHRRDTNCISLSTNANVVSTYGRSVYHNQYAIVAVPKEKINDSKFYISGKFLIEEIQTRIQKLIDNHYLDNEKVRYIDLIKNAKTDEELFNILNEYSSLSSNTYNFNRKKFYDFYALNEEQNLEKNKIIAQLDIINRRLLTRCSNRLLLESVKFAFTSSEVLHYKDITENFSFISPTTIDLFSLLQQAVSMGFDKEKVRKLELKVIKCARKNLRLENGKYGQFNTTIRDYISTDNNIKISDMYELTDSKVPYIKASKSLQFSQDIANSKLRTNDLCSLLKEIANDPELNDLIDDIREKCYVINPRFISRNLQLGLKLSDSLCLNINRDKEQIFSTNEQNSILDYINSLTDSERISFIKNNGQDNERLLCGLLNHSNDDISLNRYYAETILDYLNLDEIYNASYLQKSLSSDEKNKILAYLEKANCINMFDSLSEIGLQSKKISGIIFNLLLNNGYQEQNFIDLSNSDGFKELIASNLENVNSKVSALRLDYLLGIRDNDNHVPTSNINLRDYQQLAVDKADEIFETKNFAGVVLPTGAGKSFVAIAEMLKYKNQNIIYYAPNREILRQLQKHILKYVLNISVIPESEEAYYLEHQDRIPDGFIFRSDIEEMINVAFPQLNMYCYQGLTTKEDEFFKTRNAGLIVLDEVHRTGAEEWNERIKALIINNPNAKILGITATPIRDVDKQNMVEKLAEFSGAYTKEEIKKKKYMAAEMYLVDAMQEGIVVTPNIVTFDYSLENSEQYEEVKRKYESEQNSSKKEELKKIYDDMRKIIEVSQKRGMANIIKEGFLKNHKPLNGRYIVFLPTNSNSKTPTEEYMLAEIEKVKEYFKGIDSNPEVEYLLSSRKSKSENATAISRFENDSPHLKLIFAINMLNEGVHVDGIDGVIMLRPLGAGNKILYYQQIGRCIYSLDPDHELEPSEFPVIFDVYNNYLEQNMDRQVNRHTVTSDLQKLYLIREWINKHFRYPDINSYAIDEARKAITLKRIQKKYFKYLDNPVYNANLTDTEIYEIEEIVRVGISIDLWDIEIPERTIDPKERDIEQTATFKLKGEQKDFVNLFRQASKIVSDNSKKSRQLRLIDILNILDVMAEYDVDINNKTVPMECILQNIYDNIPDDILKLIKEDITADVRYELGKEYNEAKKQFYKKNPVFLDYDISTLRKMGIFEPCNIYEGFKDIDIIDDNGFIIHGPNKFLNLNIYTSTYFDVNGLNINGLNEQNFSSGDGFFNKYNFGRDGYYYELTADGEYVKTDSIYNPYGFDVKGDYYELQDDGTYKNLGKIDSHGYDIAGIYYKYNNITKEYVKTNEIMDDRGFDRDGIYCAIGESIAHKTRVLEYSDGVTRTFENVTYCISSYKTNRYDKFFTELPYDLNYFDRDGYYYILDKDGNRIKSDRKYNERFLDAYSNYYELLPDGTRQKTDRKYDDDYFDLNGYYYKLQSDGRRAKTRDLTDKNGANYQGLVIKYTLNMYNSSRKVKYVAFDQEGYCYEYIKRKLIKLDPPSKISKYGFDIDGYYHELLPDGTRNEKPTQSRIDPYGFDECGIFKKDDHDTIFNEHGFTQAGYYKYTDSKKDANGFDIDGLCDFKMADGSIRRLPFNHRFLSRDGYYYKRVQKEDGTYKRVITNRRVDARGFDLSGTHYDVFINNTTKELIYKNPLKYDKYGFDVDGIYYEIPKVIYRSGGARNLSFQRVMTSPASKTDEHGFNFRGFYCEMIDGKMVTTNSKFNHYGFDRDGYYCELVDGEKSTRDLHGFDIEGLSENGTIFDRFHFTQKDYYDYEHLGIIHEVKPCSFDIAGYYHDKNGHAHGKIDEHGFDKEGYYHELLPNGKRDEKPTDKHTDPRGFAGNGRYYGSKQNGRSANGTSLVDARGFDIDGLFIVDGGNTPYDRKYFDLEGYYYELQEDGKYVKTNRKYNLNFFDRDGYYYKLEKDGSRVKTDGKFNDEGIDCNGFNQEGKHVVTKLDYDENYFRADGINIITGTNYSLNGYDINGFYNPVMVSTYASTYMYDSEDQDLECVYIARKALQLPFEKRDLIFDEIPSDLRNKKVLTEKLYKYIVAAAVLDSSIKEMLIEYLKKLSEEIKKLVDELKKEKAKADRNDAIIKEYEKKLASYREMKRKTEIGDIGGRNI